MTTSTVLLNNTLMASGFAGSQDHSSHPSSSCPQCGYHLPPHTVDPSNEAAEAHRRIRDLEAQVRLLNSKAASAVDKLADYEDEIRYLREASSRSQQSGQVGGLGSSPLEGPGPAVAPSTQLPHQQHQQQSRLASLSSFLPGRRKEVHAGHPPLTPATSIFSQNNTTYSNSLSPPKTPFAGPNYNTPDGDPGLSLSSLQSSLEEERTLRLRAESSLSQTQTELEDLTAQLFGQANEMVATERKARAKLEERVKVLEQRDVDKRKRLDRLEKAVQRIERVRGLVGP